MIDCHAHLCLSDFDADRAQVLARARKVGVERIVAVGESLDDDLRVLEICREYPRLLSPCIGLHPDRFAEDRMAPDEEDIQALWKLAREHRSEIVGIGEVGLDYWHVKSPERREGQVRFLERMVSLALELDLPLNVHSRSAGRYTLEVLESAGASRVLMHAFDGKAGHARHAAESCGFFFSIPPSVVRSGQKQKLVRTLPLECLALESDSPVLGPFPGERNEPANLLHTVSYIAGVKGVSEDRVMEVTTGNARALFGLAHRRFVRNFVYEYRISNKEY